MAEALEQNILLHYAQGNVPVHIRMGVLTFKRPQLLAKTLHSLLEQTLIARSEAKLDIVVVDNDETESAREIVSTIAATSPVELRYLCEPRRGIVHGRNRVLQEVGESDWLAILDDDEIADKDWLENLLATQVAYDADIVSGPVFPIFESAPEWVKDGGFFAPQDFPTGYTPRFLATNNILLRSSFARTHRFDERFNMTSGEDTFFFMQLARAGAKSVWCAEARVYDLIPAARATEKWLVERERSSANRYSRSCLYLDPGAKTVMRRAVKVAGNLVVGTWLVATGIFSRARRVSGLRQLQRAAGTFEALRGSSHVYYKAEEPIV